VRKSEDLDDAFASIVKEKPDGLLIISDRYSCITANA